MHQRLSAPEFFADLVYKLKEFVGTNKFSAQIIKVIANYKKIGYKINVSKLTARLVVKQSTVGNFVFLKFTHMTVWVRCRT